MNLKKPILSSFICFLLLLGLLSSPLSSLAQSPIDISFTNTCQQLKQFISEAQFDQAAILLPTLDSLAQIQPTPEQAADLLFYKAYFRLFQKGDLECYHQLLAAASAYNTLSLSTKTNLAEVYLAVSLYHLGRYEECTKKAEQLIANVPLEEEEVHGVAHNIASAVYAAAGGDPDLGISHSLQAIPYFKKTKNYRRLTSLYGILTACYNAKEAYATVSTHLDSATHFAQLANNKQQVAFLKIRRGMLNINLHRAQEALANFFEAEEYYLTHGSEHGELGWIYNNLKNYYESIGDYKKVYQYVLLTDSISSALRIKENDKAINDLMVQYETEKKEQQIKMQTLVIENERQRSQQIIFGALGGLLLLCLLFGLSYFYYRQRQQEQLRQTQLQHQKQLLKATVDTQEEERKRIARDLHDGIGQQLSGLKLGFQQLSEKLTIQQPPQQGELDRLVQILADASKDIRVISHQMMPVALQEFGLIAAIDDMLDKSFPQADIQYHFDHHGITQRLPESIEIGLYRITQELINNILKHAQASEVDVQLIKNKKQVILLVEDNGIGFDTSSIKNEGHGLTNIQSRLQAIKGSVDFESRPSKGTVARIRVDLS